MKLIYYLRKLEDAPILWVYPEDIVYKSYIDRYTKIDLSGDFDRLGWLITETATYKAFSDRLNGIPWSETELYTIGVEKKRHWLGRLNYWNKMLFDIVENGYTHRPIVKPIDNYISVLIGRDGDIIFHNGIHRLCAAKLSKVRKKIPVKLIIRHAEWTDFRNKVFEFRNKNPRKQLYCQVPHPDLDQIKYLWGNDRADWIEKYSLYPKGNLVDIGVNWGTVSYTLAQKGFKVTAIENHPTPWEFLKKVVKFPGKQFSIAKRDFTRMKITADTLVALNIAHHFMKDESKRKKFVQFLNNLNVKEIFCQIHGWTGKIATQISPEETIKLIMENTGMTNSQHLTTINHRPLYHLWKL